MSQANNLINDKKSVMAYLKKVSALPYVKDLYLIGSRAKGTERKDSDWDIYVDVKFPVINFNSKYGRKEGYNIDFSTGVGVTKKTNKKI